MTPVVTLTDTGELQEKADQLRRDVVEMVYRAQSGHPGGALGVADIMTLLYYRHMEHRPGAPDWPGRDRFVLSNGHICPILYAVLADTGYFPREELDTLRQYGSRLQGHPSVAKGLPGVEYSGGSLGNGLSYALGIALSSRLSDESYRVYCMVGDGDCQEGQTWEAAMAAVHHNAHNLTVLVDLNRTQIDGDVTDIMNHAPLADKWRAFGWHTLPIDGHDLDTVDEALKEAAATERPTAVVCRTVIGKGVSYMEGDYRWHHGVPTDEQYEQAVSELSG